MSFSTDSWRPIRGDLSLCERTSIWPMRSPIPLEFIYTPHNPTTNVADCEGAWEAWGACTQECGNSGTQTRFYRVTRQATPGGRACPFAPNQKQARECNRIACQCTKKLPVAPANGKVSFSAGNDVGSEASFLCNPGFRLADDAAQTTVVCAAKTTTDSWPPVATAKCIGRSGRWVGRLVDRLICSINRFH